MTARETRCSHVHGRREQEARPGRGGGQRVPLRAELDRVRPHLPPIGRHVVHAIEPRRGSLVLHPVRIGEHILDI